LPGIKLSTHTSTSGFSSKNMIIVIQQGSWYR
jgi:hypothetical protein